MEEIHGHETWRRYTDRKHGEIHGNEATRRYMVMKHGGYTWP